MPNIIKDIKAYILCGEMYMYVHITKIGRWLEPSQLQNKSLYAAFIFTFLLRSVY